MTCRKPCPSCPWRVDQHAEDIPNFSLELAEKLVGTTSDQPGAPIFACHQSQDQKEVVCSGWLARYGWDSIGVRIKLMYHEIDVEQLNAAELPDWPETHETFTEVIEKLRADCDE